MSSSLTRNRTKVGGGLIASALALGVLVISSPVFSGQGEWTWIAPLNEAALSEVELQPMSQGRDLYLLYWWLLDPDLASDQVQKSDDFGSTWTGVGPGANRPLDLALTTNPQILYLSALDGLYRSQDGGSSWLHVSTERVFSMAVDPADPSALVANVEGNLSVSQDGGATWTATGGGGTPIFGGATSLALDADDPACSPFCVYAGAQELGEFGVLQSEDGGWTWSELWADSGFGFPIVSVDPHEEGAIWVAVRDRLGLGYGSLEKWSRLAGLESTALPCGPNDLGVPGGLAVDPLSADTLFVSCRVCDPFDGYRTDGALFVTTDGGQTWQPALDPYGGQLLSPVVVADGSERTIHVPVIYGCLGQISFVEPDRLLSYTLESQQSEVLEDQNNPGSTPVTITFDNLVVGGESSLATSTTGPPPPSGFSLGDPPIYYDITTTASFAGEVEVCIDYSGTSLERPGDLGEDALALFHYEDGAWEDRTSSRNPGANIICARVGSLSPFAVFTPDSDGDGVADGQDSCPLTAIPETVPTVRLRVNGWALVDSDTIFDTTPPDGKTASGAYTTADTAGCSCEQIIARVGLSEGHVKFGCSRGALEDWIESQ